MAIWPLPCSLSPDTHSWNPITMLWGSPNCPKRLPVWEEMSPPTIGQSWTQVMWMSEWVSLQRIPPAQHSDSEFSCWGTRHYGAERDKHKPYLFSLCKFLTMSIRNCLRTLYFGVIYYTAIVTPTKYSKKENHIIFFIVYSYVRDEAVLS